MYIPANLFCKEPFYNLYQCSWDKRAHLRWNWSHCAQNLTSGTSCLWFGLMKPQDLIYIRWGDSLEASLWNFSQLTSTNPQKCCLSLPARSHSWLPLSCFLVCTLNLILWEFHTLVECILIIFTSTALLHTPLKFPLITLCPFFLLRTHWVQ